MGPTMGPLCACVHIIWKPSLLVRRLNWILSWALSRASPPKSREVSFCRRLLLRRAKRLVFVDDFSSEEQRRLPRVFPAVSSRIV